MKNILILGGVIVVIIGIIFIVNGAGEEQETPQEEVVALNAVTSNDGTARLLLPEGLSKEGISVNRLTLEELNAKVTDPEDAEALALTEEDLEDVLIYEFGPDGKTFDEEVIFSTQIPSTGEAIPSVYHLSEGDMTLGGTDEVVPFVLESVDNVKYIYDEETETMTIEAPVQHFSSIVIYGKSKYLFFDIKAEGDRKLVGEVVNPSVALSKGASSVSYGNYPDNTIYKEVHEGAISGRWFVPPAFTWKIYKEHDGKKGQPSIRFTIMEDTAKLKGQIEQGRKAIFTPNLVFKNRPPLVPLGEKYTIPSKDFTCTKVGFGYINFTVDLSWTEKVELQRAWDPTWRELYIKERNASLEIVTLNKCSAQPIVEEETSMMQLDPVMTDAIEYAGVFLPLDQLHITDEEECGSRHYHAPSGSVTATDGSEVVDPGPLCGFGYVSSFEVVSVPAQIEEEAVEYRDGTEVDNVRKLNGLNPY